MPKSQFQPPALPGGSVTVRISTKQSISTKDIFPESNVSLKATRQSGGLKCFLRTVAADRRTNVAPLAGTLKIETRVATES